MRRNEYLRDRMINRDGRRGRRDRAVDMRRGGGYRDYRRDYEYDYTYDEPDYRYDYGDMDHEYKADLKNWIEKLKHKDKFRLSPQDIEHKAKSMGVKFEDYDELEFEATYYMLLSDFGNVSNDPHTYLAMAKSFLEDDDIKVSPSEKLCIYYYKIVKGE